MDDKEEEPDCQANSAKDEDTGLRVAGKKHEGTASEPADLQDESGASSKKNKEVQKDALIGELQDRLLRLQADFQNYQKRLEREMTEFRSFANARLLGDLLFVIDDFQNALSSAKSGKKSELLRGYEMIYNKLMEILVKEGLSEIKTDSEPFDPWQHEAVESIPSDSHPENTILDVVQKGYMFKGRIIRPAKVRVSTGMKSENKHKKSEDADDEEDDQ